MKKLFVSSLILSTVLSPSLVLVSCSKDTQKPATPQEPELPENPAPDQVVKYTYNKPLNFEGNWTQKYFDSPEEASISYFNEFVSTGYDENVITKKNFYKNEEYDGELQTKYIAYEPFIKELYDMGDVYPEEMAGSFIGDENDYIEHVSTIEVSKEYGGYGEISLSHNYKWDNLKTTLTVSENEPLKKKINASVIEENVVTSQVGETTGSAASNARKSHLNFTTSQQGVKFQRELKSASGVFESITSPDDSYKETNGNVIFNDGQVDPTELGGIKRINSYAPEGQETISFTIGRQSSNFINNFGNFYLVGATSIDDVKDFKVTVNKPAIGVALNSTHAKVTFTHPRLRIYNDKLSTNANNEIVWQGNHNNIGMSMGDNAESFFYWLGSGYTGNGGPYTIENGAIYGDFARDIQATTLPVGVPAKYKIEFEENSFYQPHKKITIYITGNSEEDLDLNSLSIMSSNGALATPETRKSTYSFGLFDRNFDNSNVLNGAPLSDDESAFTGVDLNGWMHYKNYVVNWGDYLVREMRFSSLLLPVGVNSFEYKPSEWIVGERIEGEHFNYSVFRGDDRNDFNNYTFYVAGAADSHYHFKWQVLDENFEEIWVSSISQIADKNSFPSEHENDLKTYRDVLKNISDTIILEHID